MPNAAANLPAQRRARTRREATASVRLARLPPPVLEADEDTRGWIEAHFQKLVFFVGSAAIAAAIVSRVLPSHPQAVPPAAVVVRIPSVVATPATEPEVAMPMPAAAIEVAAAPVAAIAPAPMEQVAVTHSLPSVQVAKVSPASRRHAKARSSRTLAHAAEARTAPLPALEHAAPGGARSAYNRGDLDTAERLLRRAGHVGQADRVASIKRFLSAAQGELREHDEAPATRTFEAAARADRALGFGAGKIARDLSHQVGLLHVAAGLRARRAGNEDVARSEFEAAHRADPTNGRAASELQSQEEVRVPVHVRAPAQDEVNLQDAIDPE